MIVRIATRGSRLALWQAEHVRTLLAAYCELDSEIVVVKTSGDQFTQGHVGKIGLKGVFIKELEEALLENRADIAVHSMKDVPTEVDSRFSFPAVLKRDDHRDCILTRSPRGFDSLVAGSRVGTSSIRRQAQLRHFRPDLDLLTLRGNVDTRLTKLDSGDYDGIILAKAGLDRLGLSGRVTGIFSTDMILPAVGQGAIGIETRAGDPKFCKLVARLSDPDTRAAVNAERALLAELEGGCEVPVGAWARWEEGVFVLDACVVSPDGTEYIRLSADATAEQMRDWRTPLDLGELLGSRLLETGGDRILRALRGPVH